MTRREALWLGAGLAAVGVLLVLTWPYVLPWSGKDEGYYLRYATQIAQQGLRGFPALFLEYTGRPDTHQVFPPPIRVATIALGAWMVRIGGPQFQSLMALSLVAFLGLLAVTYRQVRAWCGLRTAVWATALLAASPLHLAMARRAMADSLLATVAVVTLWCAIQAIVQDGSGRRWRWLAAGLALACLVKEEAVVLIPIIIGLAVCHAGWSGRRMPGALGVACAAALGLVAVVAVLAAGGVSTAWDTVRLHLAAVGENRYAAVRGAGPWFRYLIDGCLLSPWIIVLFLGWLGFVWGSRQRDDRARLWTLAPVLFLVCAAPFTKNARYALWLEFPLRFGAVRMIQQCMGDRPGDRRRAFWITGLILGLIAMDLWTFYHVFVREGLYDPLTEWLLMKRGILPLPPS
ncbi:MAG: glycosyltransferase family 39 protein [Candidatus Omnitrophica bacterium]|nr:glycosyltransferase family 39 protein [Candidatus Omnitrophota bacterium]